MHFLQTIDKPIHTPIQNTKHFIELVLIAMIWVGDIGAGMQGVEVPHQKNLILEQR